MDRKLQASLKRERHLKLATVLVLLGMGITVLLAVNNMLLSFVLAFVINYLLSPFVNFLERRGVARQTAILVPFLSGGLIIGFGFYKLLPLIIDQLAALESQLPKYQYDLMHLVASTEQRFRGFFKLYDIKFSQTVNDWILAETARLSHSLPSAVSGSLTVLMLSPFFAFFMLQDGRRMSRRVLSFVPNNLFETALQLHHQINEQMGGFIRARFLEAAIVGLVVGLGLQLVGFPYASLLGLFAAVTNLIPYLGPIIGAVPAVLIALISRDGIIAEPMSLNLIIVTSIYFIAQLIDIVFIIPFVVAKIVNLHPVTVIIVIIIGSQLMGILGMVISIPVASALKLTFSAFYEHITDFRS
jgi:putative permease